MLYPDLVRSMGKAAHGACQRLRHPGLEFSSSGLALRHVRITPMGLVVGTTMAVVASKYVRAVALYYVVVELVAASPETGLFHIR